MARVALEFQLRQRVHGALHACLHPAIIAAGQGWGTQS